jgi:hypothetical protein
VVMLFLVQNCLKFGENVELDLNITGVGDQWKDEVYLGGRHLLQGNVINIISVKSNVAKCCEQSKRTLYSRTLLLTICRQRTFAGI